MTVEAIDQNLGLFFHLFLCIPKPLGGGLTLVGKNADDLLILLQEIALSPLGDALPKSLPVRFQRFPLHLFLSISRLEIGRV